MASLDATNPSNGALLMVHANISLKRFELHVPSSDFSCLLFLEDENTDLKRLTALTELKSMIWAHSDFQNCVLDAMEVVVIPPDEEKEEEEGGHDNEHTEQQQEKKKEEQKQQMQHEEEFDQKDQQEEEEKEEFDEEEEMQQQQATQPPSHHLQLQSLGKRPRTRREFSLPNKRPRTEEEEEDDDEADPRDESDESILNMRHRTEEEGRGESEASIGKGIESDSEEIVTAIANVLQDPRQPNQQQDIDDGKESCSTKSKDEDDDDDDDDDDDYKEQSDDDENDDKQRQKYIEQKQYAHRAEQDKEQKAEPPKSKLKPVVYKAKETPLSPKGKNVPKNQQVKPKKAVEFEFLTKIVWQSGPLGMKVNRYRDTITDNLGAPYVIAILKNSAAEQAGIQIGDIITSVGQLNDVSYETFVENSFQRPLVLVVKREFKEVEKNKHNFADAAEAKDSENEKVVEVNHTKSDSRFVQNVLKLKEFYKEHGHYRIPRKGNNELRLLRKWYDCFRSRARAYRRDPNPTPDPAFVEKIELLDALENFDWGVEPGEPWQPRSKTFDWKKYDWDTCYELLKQYKAKHGDCYVPVNSKEYPNLAKWCLHLRNHGYAMRKHGKTESNILTPERVQKLDELGYPWNLSASLWNDMYIRLKKYKEEHGHCRVPKRYAADPKLGCWCYEMRRGWKRRCQGIKTERMTDERFRLLDELGFVWNPKQS